MRRSVGIGALAVGAFLMRDRLRALVRVKSELGASTGNVDVNAQDGRVQLRGESQGMIDELGSRARDEGVRDVDNLLHLPGSEARPNQ